MICVLAYRWKRTRSDLPSNSDDERSHVIDPAGFDAFRTQTTAVARILSVDGRTAMFHHATQHSMEILRCGSCGTLLAPDATRCSSCRCADLESACCPATGSIVCWKVMEPVEGAGEEAEPVTLAIVELDDGPWVYSKIDGTFPEHADGPVRVELQAAAGTDRFPVFGVCAA